MAATFLSNLLHLTTHAITTIKAGIPSFCKPLLTTTYCSQMSTWAGLEVCTMHVYLPILQSIASAIKANLLQGDPLLMVNHTIPVFLVGDSAYPLLRWLIKPFLESSVLTNRQKTFNYRICHGCVAVEMAFGCLKARWRHL